MSNLGRWNEQYAAAREPAAYGDDTTYRLGAEFLANCPVVEDWGCGLGWLRRFLSPEQTYRGLDGSHSPFADQIVDLATVRSRPDGLFMRHVLEHNDGWRAILDNALASFERRMALIIFTPLMAEQTRLGTCGRTGVPDWALPVAEMRQRLALFDTIEQQLATATHYGAENVFFISRP